MLPPNHPILIGFSTINHPFWGPTPIFGNIHVLTIDPNLQRNILVLGVVYFLAGFFGLLSLTTSTSYILSPASDKIHPGCAISTALESIILPTVLEAVTGVRGKVDGNEWQRLFFSTKLFNLSSHT